MKRVVQVVAALTAAGGALAAAFVVGMRRKSPALLRTVRRMNRAVFNPDQMKTAGTPGAYASVIRHVGRSSGRRYETPVGAAPTDDGFAIALPYGTQPDWLRNVLAAGSATLVHEGATYEVDQPEVVALAEVDEAFEPKARRTHQLFGIDEALRLHRVEQGRSSDPAEDGAGASLGPPS